MRQSLLILTILLVALLASSCGDKKAGLTGAQLADAEILAEEDPGSNLPRGAENIAGNTIYESQFRLEKKVITYLSCKDSDDKREYDRQGKVVVQYYYGDKTSKTTKELTDSCSGNTLKEYYCIDKRHGIELYPCPGQCQNGACIAPPSCTDTDYDGYGAQGTDLTGCSASTTAPDCNDANSAIIACVAGENCVSGVCQSTSPPPSAAPAASCTDSDNGANTSERGTTTGLGATGALETQTDSCRWDRGRLEATGNQVNEWYCRNSTHYTSRIIDCPQGQEYCKEGSCQRCLDNDWDGYGREEGPGCLHSGIDCKDDDPLVNVCGPGTACVEGRCQAAPTT